MQSMVILDQSRAEIESLSNCENQNVFKSRDIYSDSSIMSEQIDLACELACKAIAPTWPLDRAIAVNPHWERIGMPLRQVAARMALLGNISVFPSRESQLLAWKSGRIGQADLDIAIKQVPDAQLQGLTAEEYIDALHNVPSFVGAEALIRWQHPEHGLLPPAAFLPIIENHPLSVELGEWVIAAALQQMADWRSSGLNLPVSVNISAMQLQRVNFVERLADMLAAQPGVEAQCLELEVLETSALEDVVQVSEVMHRVQAMGVRFALDDFGTGYSSLTYLKRLPAEMIKIDQSFVRDMLIDRDDLAIVTGVIGLAGAFKRKATALPAPCRPAMCRTGWRTGARTRRGCYRNGSCIALFHEG